MFHTHSPDEWVPPHDDDLRKAVAPSGWLNPRPKDRYNLVVVGGGTAGLVAAAGAAGLGARVALIETRRLGGDCLNFGCVPSKGLLAAAHLRNKLKNLSPTDDVANVQPLQFTAVMQEMRRMRAGLSHHDSANRFAGLGVDVFLGQGRFVGPDAIEVTPWETASSDSQPTPVGRLRFHRAIIATGARPSIPTLPGIEHVSVLTNENVFSLEELPGRLGVLGGGPIGVELAQAFARMGSQVTLINRGPRILSRDDPDAAAIVGQQLIDDGIDLQLNCHDITFESQSDGSPATVRWRGKDGGSHSAVVDHLLVAAGRVPNVEGLGLDSANVAFDVLKGVLVDDGLQTTNPRIFAAGDVCSRWKFTHAADFQARTALRNALFPSPFGFGRARVSRLVIPWCTYSSPELAQVGLTGDQAARQGVAIDTYELPFAGVDRAVLENSTTGFTRVHVHQGTDRIVGATIVGDRAGELIGQFSFAIRHKLGLGSFAQAIYPYPTVAEAVRKMGDIQQRSRLTPTVKAWLAKWWAWQVS